MDMVSIRGLRADSVLENILARRGMARHFYLQRKPQNNEIAKYRQMKSSRFTRVCCLGVASGHDYNVHAFSVTSMPFSTL
jgi:hypothetical protein